MLTKKYSNGFVTLDATKFSPVAQETIDREIKDEIENPTQIDGNIDDWILKIAKNAHSKNRERPLSQLLFFMLRSGK